MLWIVITAAAAPLQVARNALQRGLIGDAGPWGATLVRFLFGLPFSLSIFGIVAALTPAAQPHVTAIFLGAATIGAVCQMAATACLLVAMRRAETLDWDRPRWPAGPDWEDRPGWEEQRRPDAIGEAPPPWPGGRRDLAARGD